MNVTPEEIEDFYTAVDEAHEERVPEPVVLLPDPGPAMTPNEQVAMHERVEDARRILLDRKTEEGYAFAGLLSGARSEINARLRKSEPVGMLPHRLERACAAILGEPRHYR